jgi:conjugative transposon TraM protein
MEKKIHSAKYANKRKFLLVLPLLTLPFLTLMFWAFGGGKGNLAVAQSNTEQGLNLKLPNAKLKDDKSLNKLSFYQQAALDSAKARQAEKLDPYWNKFSNDSSSVINSTNDYGMDANKMKVYNKLDELKKALNNAERTSSYRQSNKDDVHTLKSYSSTGDIDRLQATMKQMQTNQTEDPEITQLNEMLDKIQTIQNPAKAGYVSKQPIDKSLPVRTKKNIADVTFLKSDSGIIESHDTITQDEKHNAFYGLYNINVTGDSNNNNAIECFIPETQALVTGAMIKIALSNDVTINTMSLPSGTLIYGAASISNERLKISINLIRYENSILPVSLNVYDMDGQEGIFIPGSISGTVAKESTNKAVSGMDPTIVDPSIGAQAASAGIEAAKTLIGKKVKLIKVTVKSGYKILLKNSNER